MRTKISVLIISFVFLFAMSFVGCGEQDKPKQAPKAPEVETSAPEAETQAPKAETSTPEADTQAIEAKTSTPEAETQTIQVENIAPEKAAEPQKDSAEEKN